MTKHDEAIEAAANILWDRFCPGMKPSADDIGHYFSVTQSAISAYLSTYGEGDELVKKLLLGLNCNADAAQAITALKAQVEKYYAALESLEAEREEMIVNAEDVATRRCNAEDAWGLAVMERDLFKLRAESAEAERDRLTLTLRGVEFIADYAQAENVKLRETMEDIANSDDIDNALDPARSKRVARAALSEHQFRNPETRPEPDGSRDSETCKECRGKGYSLVDGDPPFVESAKQVPCPACTTPDTTCGEGDELVKKLLLGLNCNAEAAHEITTLNAQVAELKGKYRSQLWRRNHAEDELFDMKARAEAAEAEAEVWADRALTEQRLKFEQMAENVRLREALCRAAQAMQSVGAFVTSREKIKNPEGREWWAGEIAAVRAALNTPQQPSDAPTGGVETN